MVWNRSVRVPGALLFTACLAMSAAAAQEIPAEMLKLDRERCSRDCMESLDDEAVCKQLCDCTIDQFKKKLSFKAYLKISGELAQGKTSRDSRKALDEIANFCAANIKWPEEAPETEKEVTSSNPG